MNKVGKNRTELSDAIWFIYRIYLDQYKDFSKAIKKYEKDLRDPFCYMPPTVLEIVGMMFIKEYTNEQSRQKQNSTK